MIKMEALVINARFGNMTNEETNKNFDWGKVTIIEQDQLINDGFAGVKTAEIKVNVDSDNKLIKRLHSQIAQGEIVLPAKLELHCDMVIKQKDVVMVVNEYAELNG